MRSGEPEPLCDLNAQDAARRVSVRDSPLCRYGEVIRRPARIQMALDETGAIEPAIVVGHAVRDDDREVMRRKELVHGFLAVAQPVVYRRTALKHDNRATSAEHCFCPTKHAEFRTLYVDLDGVNRVRRHKVVQFFHSNHDLAYCAGLRSFSRTE